MKTTIGGDRLGSGNKQNISLKHYNRSTHDLSYAFRSSMAVGTLVPFMKVLGLPGDSFDIDLFADVKTLPTVGPLFGSMKVQLDVFQVPIRLYNARLHMNELGIGMEMDNVKLPQIAVTARNNGEAVEELLKNNRQIAGSCLLKYLGISGIGRPTGDDVFTTRLFNAVPLLAYWDIYKNYYANKQEERGFFIHTDDDSVGEEIGQAYKIDSTGQVIGSLLDNEIDASITGAGVKLYFGSGASEPDATLIEMLENGTPRTFDLIFPTIVWNEDEASLTCTGQTGSGSQRWEVEQQTVLPKNVGVTPVLEEFNLDVIDNMRLSILQHTPIESQFLINNSSDLPYGAFGKSATVDGVSRMSASFPMEGLGIKTYQSDLFNNWISTEWIDGTNGINEVTAVSTAGDEFTIDSLNLAMKVYTMLNRIAISGGSYDDWLDAVYTQERSKSIESPMYMGSLIRELAFEEVISNSDSEIDGNTQPLGTLAGRGAMTDKTKGGKIKVKCDEPSYIIGIASITPRIDYSQGNDWDMNLATMDDLHKPALDAIGYQDLITDQMAWQDTTIDNSDSVVFSSAGKQPAWINYMTAVNKVYGRFSEVEQDMFMTLNRRYDIGESGIEDLTTYIDPSKFNFIFAQTSLDAQNYWMQIGVKNTARRKMSAKVIPNL